MQKTILTFIFLVAFICAGNSLASAKSPASQERSISASKRATVANKRTKVLKLKCKTDAPCLGEWAVLMAANAAYEYACAPEYLSSCAPELAWYLEGAGMAYEFCLNNPYEARNSDNARDRDKLERSRVVAAE